MNVIDLPDLPRDTEYQPFPVAAGGAQRPAFGGPSLPTPRTGDKWGFEVRIRALDAVCGEALMVDLVRGSRIPVRMRVGEPGSPVVNYGAPLTDGSGQLGSTLALKGLTPGAVILKGKWLSFEVAGRSYLYKVAVQAAAGSDGRVSVPIEPMIRRAPGNNVAVRLAQPIVQGFVTLGNGWSSKRFGQHGVNAVDFRIEEQA